MECKAIQSAVSRDWVTGKVKIEYQIESSVSPADIERATGKILRLKAVQWKEKRSLDANAYYWVLLSRLAEVLHISKPRAHNLMLRKYGQPETFDGAGAYIRIPDTVKAEEEALEASTYHIRPTSQVVSGTDGVNYRTYVLIKGSSEYDTREMGELIDGLIGDCKELGIETLPPEEITRMLQTYESNRRKNDGEKAMEHSN